MRRLQVWFTQKGWVGLILALVAGISLLNYAPWTAVGHDSFYHTGNITAIIEALQDGESIKILPEIAKNLGYGSGIFYPQLFHVTTAVVAIVFSPLTTNLFYAIWATHWLFLFLSGVFFYALIKKILDDSPWRVKARPANSWWVQNQAKLAALLSSGFYMTAAYHLVDIIVRDAQAEVLIFTFAPMVILGLWYLFKNRATDRWKFYTWFILGYTGLFYSHLPLTMYFTILLTVVLLINWRQVFTKRFLQPFLLATLVVIMLVLPFLLPMLEQILATQYAVYADTGMASNVNFSGYVYDYFSFGNISSGDGFPITLNFVMLILALVAALALIRRRIKLKNQRFVVSVLAVLGIGAFVLMLHIFPWVVMPKFFLMLQFAWRLNVFLILALSIAAGIGLYYLPSKWQKVGLVLGGLFCLVSIVQINNMENTNKNRHINYEAIWVDHDYYPDAESVDWEPERPQEARHFSMANYNFEDTSIMAMGYQGEYLPLRAWQRWDQVLKIGIEQKVSVLSGSAQVEVVENQTPDLKLRVNQVAHATKIELPRLYYVGYTITAHLADGTEQELIYRESELGLIEITVDQDAEIKISYTGTQLDKVAYALAGATAVTSLICIYFAANQSKRRKAKQNRTSN